MDTTVQSRSFLARIRRRWHIVALCFASGLIAASIFLLLVAPRFTAEATLKLDLRQDQLDAESQGTASDLLDRLIAGEAAVLGSRELIQRVVAAEQLLVDPEIGEKSILDRLRSLLLGESDGEASQGPRHDRVIDNFKSALRVETPERTNLITIRFTSRDREKAARIANAVANAYLARHLEQHIDARPLASQWLEDRSEALRKEWKASERRLQSYKSKSAPDSVLSVEKNGQDGIARSEKLVLARAATRAARARVEQVERMVARRDAAGLANAVRTEAMTRLGDRLAVAARREASLSETLLPAHPTLGEARDQVAELQERIVAEGRRSLAGLKAAVTAASKREDAIRDDLDKTPPSKAETGDTGTTLRELERAAAAGKANYEAFLERSAAPPPEQATGQVVTVRLIQQARPPAEPSSPSGIEVFLLAAVWSLALGLGGALVADRIEPVAAAAGRKEPDVEMPLPTIAIVPTASLAEARAREPDARRERLVVQDPAAPFAQVIARLTARLTDYAAARGGAVLAVTSAHAREGKTMVAANIAQQAAKTGNRALLIDGNFRNPSATRVFRALHDQAATRDGQEDAGSEQPVLGDRTTGLEIVPAYADAGDALGFVGSAAFADLLSSAKASFDLVIVDTGALLSHAETRVLVGLADATLLVLDERSTPRATAMEALRTLETCRANTLGVVLNHGFPEGAPETRRADRDDGERTTGASRWRDMWDEPRPAPT